MSGNQWLSIFTIPNLWHAFLKYTPEFVGGEAGLQNPFFFLPVAWAAIVFWKRKRDNPLLLYFFSMGAPLFVGYFLLTFHARSNANWIAPSILPLFCLGVVYWDEQWRAGFRAIKYWLYTGLVVWFNVGVVLMHDLNLISKLTGFSLPPAMNPGRRVQGWAETAQAVEAAREKLLAEGKPVFIIGEHYGITSQVTFNLPEAKAGVPNHPLVYYMSSTNAENQYYYWPGYKDDDRKGQNAIFVQDIELHTDKQYPPKRRLLRDFESIKVLDPVLVEHDGHPMRRLLIIECRGLR